MVWRCDSELDIQQLIAAAMDEQELARFTQAWQASGLDDGWLPLPVHPWQWQQKIALDFVADLAEGKMVSLGEFGDQWLAQQSLRTLTNASRQGGLDVKLPLTITTLPAIAAFRANTLPPGRSPPAGCKTCSPRTARW
ncbi:Aerobactin synthase IucC [Cedecea neteri]|uniref:Aerobactin synthase IucC n=1 Tax=Cedecea neteri TaxID=158822 RepID=A0A2X3L608_9ENTR|nr:Aerobactin synthase IucC [Cedecea neteri]